MAIKGDITTRGELSVVGAYVRVVNPQVTKNEDGTFSLLYGVLVHKNKAAKDGGKPTLIVPSLDRFKCTYTLPDWPLVWPLLKPSDPPDNVFSLAYANLKSRNLIANQEDV